MLLGVYRFRSVDPIPWTRLARPLSECRVALVTTAAFYREGDEPFDESLRGGDFTFRVVPTEPAEQALQELHIGHRSTAFDSGGIEADPNVALPVDRFRELEAAGTVGSLHGQAFSFMGSITAPGRLMRQTAPELAGRLRAAEVDVAFLCPV